MSFSRRWNADGPGGNKMSDQLNEELGALHRSIERQRELCARNQRSSRKKKLASDAMKPPNACALNLLCWLGQERNYGEYARIMSNLLGIHVPVLIAAQLKMEEVIPPRRHGRAQQHLPAYRITSPELSPAGLALTAAGTLDMDKSFVHIDYFSLLHSQTVRNNVQPQVSNRRSIMVAHARSR